MRKLLKTVSSTFRAHYKEAHAAWSDDVGEKMAHYMVFTNVGGAVAFGGASLAIALESSERNGSSLPATICKSAIMVPIGTVFGAATGPALLPMVAFVAALDL